MWENVQPGRPQMTVWGMRISICMRRATNTHSAYVILLLLYRCNNGCTNTRLSYVIRPLPFLFSVLMSLCHNAHLAELLDVKAFVYSLLTKSAFKMTGKHRCEVTSYLILLLAAFPNMRHLRYTNEMKYLC